jgi:hypothetical protein
VNTDERQEIAASVAAHAELGPRYEAAVAEGLVERIGEEIDKRVDARLRGAGHSGMPPRAVPPPGMAPHAMPPHAMPPQPMPPQGPLALPPAQGPARRSPGATTAGVLLALGSMGLGVGATAVVTHNMHSAPAQVVMILLIWAAITVVNVVQAKSYWPEGEPPHRRRM